MIRIEVTKIRYKDNYDRELKISLNGTVIKTGWTNGASSTSYAEIVEIIGTLQ